MFIILKLKKMLTNNVRSNRAYQVYYFAADQSREPPNKFWQRLFGSAEKVPGVRPVAISLFNRQYLTALSDKVLNQSISTMSLVTLNIMFPLERYPRETHHIQGCVTTVRDILDLFHDFYAKIYREELEAVEVTRACPDCPERPVIGEKIPAPTEVFECCICKGEDLEPQIVLGCKHTYHQKCIETWLNKSDKCPLCRQPQPPVQCALCDNARVITEVGPAPNYSDYIRPTDVEDDEIPYRPPSAGPYRIAEYFFEDLQFSALLFKRDTGEFTLFNAFS